MGCRTVSSQECQLHVLSGWTAWIYFKRLDLRAENTKSGAQVGARPLRVVCSECRLHVLVAPARLRCARLPEHLDQTPPPILWRVSCARKCFADLCLTNACARSPASKEIVLQVRSISHDLWQLISSTSRGNKNNLPKVSTPVASRRVPSKMGPITKY